MRRLSLPGSLLLLALTAGCGTPSTPAPDSGVTVDGPHYVLNSVVIDADGNRTTYAQVVTSLEGPFDNKNAIEIPGNGNVMATSDAFFAGLVEAPVWVKYVLDENGAVKEAGRVSFASYGVSTIDYGNTIVDDETAVSAFSDPAIAIVWNPKTMTVKGQVSLSHQLRAGFSTEVWTTVAHGGLVYIPARWSDWTGNRIYPGVGLTILDPKKLEVLGMAEDDRCASGGRPVFDARGYAYVMGDGRTYSIQMFANAAGTAAPENCLLRIAPGALDFEANYFFTIPSLTGGVDSISELGAAKEGTGVAFALMFHPDQLPPNVKPVDFGFWNEPAHKTWRLNLGDTPTAVPVQNAPFAAVGFTPVAMNGKLYAGGAPGSDGLSEVYVTDPESNAVTGPVFKMEGYFAGLYELKN
jgi:hypothetical protein